MCLSSDTIVGFRSCFSLSWSLMIKGLGYQGMRLSGFRLSGYGVIRV